MTPPDEKYVQLLKSHDWYYEYSDDHRVWRAGSAAYGELRGLQKTLDPQGLVWNKYAPDDFKMKPPEPKDINLLPPANVKKRGSGPAP